MKQYFAVSVLVLLAACASPRFAPLAGMPAALGEAVSVGSLRVTPRSVIEDSRCPSDAECAQAGRLVVSTRIDGPGWSETAPLTLGEPYPVQGATVTLVSGRPEQFSERRTPKNEYRFIFQGG